jgi:hypothetical protein
VDADVQREIRGLLGRRIFFVDSYANVNYGVVATHGHQFDSDNFARFYGQKVNGRQVVENFSTLVEGITNLTGARPFIDVDAFVVAKDFAKYVRCITADKNRQGDPDNQAALAQLRQIIRDFSENEDLDLASLENLGLPRFFARLVKLAFNLGLLDELDLYAVGNAFVKDRPNAKDAQSLLNMYPGYKCVMMGHTHGEQIVELDGDAVYINTGAWMDKVALDARSPCFPEPLNNRHVTLLYREAMSDGEGVTDVVHYEMFYLPGLASDPDKVGGLIRYREGPLPRFPPGSYRVNAST